MRSFEKAIYPGKVGSEYHLTRGHYHRKRHYAETCQALSGHGLVLFEREDGTTRTAELAPGKVTYVAPFWAHRSVNTSDVPLVFLWTCSIEAGHDYESLGGRGDGSSGGRAQRRAERRGPPPRARPEKRPPGWSVTTRILAPASPRRTKRYAPRRRRFSSKISPVDENIKKPGALSRLLGLVFRFCPDVYWADPSNFIR
jgi:mannose-6-phosphate isomerase-like protein (cupin superfamily)